MHGGWGRPAWLHSMPRPADMHILGCRFVLYARYPGLFLFSSYAHFLVLFSLVSFYNFAR